jgi:hypothetical protein
MAIQLEKFKAGHWQLGSGYKFFVPLKINLEAKKVIKSQGKLNYFI